MSYYTYCYRCCRPKPLSEPRPGRFQSIHEYFGQEHQADRRTTHTTNHQQPQPLPAALRSFSKPQHHYQTTPEIVDPGPSWAISAQRHQLGLELIYLLTADTHKVLYLACGDPGREGHTARTSRPTPQSPGPPHHHLTKGPKVKSDATRIASYNAKTVPTTVGLKVASELTLMKADFATQAASFVAKEIAIQAVLNAEGDVPTIQYPFYLSFGREIWSLTYKGISGPAQVGMGTSLKTKYTSYGLDGPTLSKVALDVFAIVIP